MTNTPDRAAALASVLTLEELDLLHRCCCGGEYSYEPAERRLVRYTLLDLITAASCAAIKTRQSSSNP